jgi:hypothetical protein
MSVEVKAETNSAIVEVLDAEAAQQQTHRQRAEHLAARLRELGEPHAL